MNSESNLSRDAFQKWLEDPTETILTVRKGEDEGIVIKLPKRQGTDYLFGHRTNYGGSISWKDHLSFCGIYEQKARALYLADDPLDVMVDGLTEEERQDSSILGYEISQRVNHYVEQSIADDRTRLCVKELTDRQMLDDLQCYCQYTAREGAIELFFKREEPNTHFQPDYQKHGLNEIAMLTYIESPETFIRVEAERYMKESQEELLKSFLENDALRAEYQALVQDTENPVHQMRAITEAVEQSGAKSVSVTIRKNGQELAFKASAASLKGYHSYYSIFHLPAADRREFERVFGRHADYKAEDIVRITYGRNTLYAAKKTQLHRTDQTWEETPQRPNDDGLTEKGRQLLRDAEDPGLPHTYDWFVIERYGQEGEQLHRAASLTGAIDLYNGLACGSKRLGVTKDGIATTDLIVTQSDVPRLDEGWMRNPRFAGDSKIFKSVAWLRLSIAGLDLPRRTMTFGGM